MSSNKKAQACEACHGLKIRCEKASRLEPDHDQRCSRCAKLELKCVPTSRRRPRDRIAELEAEITGLTRALQEQMKLTGQLQNQVQNTSTRRELNGFTPLCPMTRPDLGTEPPPSAQATLTVLDSMVPKTVQKEGLKHYIENAMVLLPVVPLSEDDYDRLRDECPILLLVVLAFATTGILKDGMHHRLIGEAMQVFGMDLIGCGYRSLNYLQALLVASFWFRSKPDTKHASASQLVHLATSMAVEIGISGPDISFDLRTGLRESQGHLSSTARRTWLACLVATSSMSVTLRRGDISSWTIYEEDCLTHLSNPDDALPTDPYFCELVRSTRLTDKMAVELELFDAGRIWNLDSSKYMDIVTRTKLESHKWLDSVPLEMPEAWSLKLSNAFRLVHLYEPILHTTSNKLSFAAPYLPSRIAAGSFAAPTLTLDHVAALYALNDACQRVLLAVSDTAAATILALPAITVIPRATYTIYVLLKLYVALSAPGNTYGRVLARDQLLVEQHLDNAVGLCEALDKADPTSFNSRVLSATKSHKQWFTGYTSFLTQHADLSAFGGQFQPPSSIELPQNDMNFPGSGPVDVNPWESAEWNLQGLTDTDLAFFKDFESTDGYGAGP